MTSSELKNPDRVDEEGFSPDNIWAYGVDTERVRSKTTEGGEARLKIEHGGDLDSRDRDLERAQMDIGHIGSDWVEHEVRENETVYKLG